MDWMDPAPEDDAAFYMKYHAAAAGRARDHADRMISERNNIQERIDRALSSAAAHDHKATHYAVKLLTLSMV